jgi:hypothetical protein
MPGTASHFASRGGGTIATRGRIETWFRGYLTAQVGASPLPRRRAPTLKALVVPAADLR